MGQAVRIEVAAALKSSATVIPTLVGRTPLPDKRRLPQSIVALTERQGIELRDGSWKEDVDKLLERMRDGKVAMTRPLCPHPQVARYKGRGDTNVAASFECAKP